MMKYRHKYLWTVVSMGGGITRYETEADARVHALNYGAFGIHPPIYFDPYA